MIRRAARFVNIRRDAGGGEGYLRRRGQDGASTSAMSLEPNQPEHCAVAADQVGSTRPTSFWRALAR